MIKIQQIHLTDTIRNFIFQGFSEHAINSIGFDGIGREQITFTAYDEGEIVGTISVLTFFGALWIKYFFIKENYRNEGIGSQLMNSALKFGKDAGLTFAFVETLSFQALKFYEKNGFKLEFTRSGFQAGISFHYLRKYL
ncbi:MAG: GNAT family N-acetyltransferase [Janthinobacterium lividum]